MKRLHCYAEAYGKRDPLGITSKVTLLCSEESCFITHYLPREMTNAKSYDLRASFENYINTLQQILFHGAYNTCCLKEIYIHISLQQQKNEFQHINLPIREERRKGNCWDTFQCCYFQGLCGSWELLRVRDARIDRKWKVKYQSPRQFTTPSIEWVSLFL